MTGIVLSAAAVVLAFREQKVRKVVDKTCAEIDKLREDKRTCVLMLRALYAYFDGIGHEVDGVLLPQKEALWRCATITETLEKVGEL